LAPVAPDPSVETARAALADLIEVRAAIEDAPRRAGAAVTLTAVTERLLAAGPIADLQAAARETLAAREALASGALDTAKAALTRAVTPLVRVAQQGRIDGATDRGDASRLTGAAAAGRGGGE
jgi:hypothetical protein